MPNRTTIEWATHSSNPLIAINKENGKRGWFCTHVSTGCTNCYAETLNVGRFGNGLAFIAQNRAKVEWRLHEPELAGLMRMRGPARIFMCDMTDMFHEDVDAVEIARIWAVFACRPDLTFMVLTKRPERLANLADNSYLRERMLYEAADIAVKYRPVRLWPLPNVWVGTSVENQDWADVRIPPLLDTPAAVRFLSCEPLLGPIAFPPEWLQERGSAWVIAGGESAGPAERRLVVPCCRKGSPFPPPQLQHDRYRPTETVCDAFNSRACSGREDWAPMPERAEWARSLRDQCHAAGVPFFWKQWGGPRPKSGGRLIDGREWSEVPA